MIYTVARTRAFQNIGRGTAFITSEAITEIAIDLWFNERQRRLCHERNLWFMRTTKLYHLSAVSESALYDFPIANANTATLKYKSDLGMYIMRSSEKVVATFEAGETWTTANGGASDTTNFREGKTGWNLSPAASATEYSTSGITHNLELFSDNEEAASTDIIHCWVYVADKNNLASFSLIFDCNNADYATDIYTYTVEQDDIVDGWNEFNIVKSDFTRTGSTTGKDWGTIAGIKISATATAVAAASVTFDEIRLVQASPADYNWEPVTKIPEIYSKGSYDLKTPGRPAEYGIEGNKFRLFPFADDTYKLLLVYNGYLTDLSSDSDTNDILNDFPDILISGAMADGYRYLGEFDKAMAWEQEYERHKTEMFRLDTMKQLSPTFQLVPFKNSGKAGYSGYVKLPENLYI